ncbi:MAG: efflux RND transporter permease subunit [Leptolyngbyaceae cyanobacterium bins.349]|nr:efflux RND transporter permease subunit [Leptolyngbyaceae cyanobacterium bins.349]
MIFSIATPFIKRPVLTTVCTLIILLLGAVCIPLLPINYLPDIAPIQIRVTGRYTGADVNTVEDTVTSVLERQINGVEGMEYMTSNTFAGNSQISVFFGSDTNKDTNQVNVQNRVAQANAQLPTPVQQQGVITRASSSSILLIYGVYSETDEYDDIFISNYVDQNIVDRLQRVPGVGDVTAFGDKPNAMRLWLDPNALASRNLTVLDVVNALRSQNVVVGAGGVGQQPTPAGQEQNFELPIRVEGRFRDAREFGNLVIQRTREGGLTRLSDVGRAELGAERYVSNARVNGKVGVGVAVYQAPDSNALDIAARVATEMKDVEATLPPGLKLDLVFDTTEFVEVSIREVVITLVQAFLLVVLVIYIFLQDWRTTVIPLIAIPVALIGAMAFAFLFGFSINNLTLFGLILATGLVVDDAIVIVESCTEKIQKQGMTAKQAALASMEELSGATIATSLVLMAVFIPIAFFPGSTGKLYQQFALIIAFTVLVSTFNALSFSPSMAAILLGPPKPLTGPGGWCFTKFNQGFAWVSDRFLKLVQFFIKIRYIILGLFVAGLVATVYMFTAIPTAFVPNEDQGAFVGIVQAPDGVSLSYTDRVLDQARQRMVEIPEIESTFTVSGAGFNGNGPNLGLFFARLKPWDQRTAPEQTVDGILPRLNRSFQTITDAVVLALNPSPIPGFSATGGVEMVVQDRTGGQLSIDDFAANAREIIAQANQQPATAGTVSTTFTTGTPQLRLDLDRNKIESLNIDFQQALQTVGATLGSQFVNDFTLGSRNYRVFVQADSQFRDSTEDIGNLNVRSRDGSLVPLAEIATITRVTGPQVIGRYNSYRAITLQATEAPGYSSGQAIAALETAYKQAALPGVGRDWIGIAREQLSAGNLAALIFLFGIIMVFLTLSAQYESYIDPIIILLTVPLALLGALGSIALRGLNNDVYVNVALVMLIGLASKNAILIVEFANQSRSEGYKLVDAALKASKERFRPIMMTAASSLVGFFPLVIASGAGAAARWSLGTALFGGLLVATILSLLVVPVLYILIKSLTDRLLNKNSDAPPSPPAPPTEPPTKPAIAEEEPTLANRSNFSMETDSVGE